MGQVYRATDDCPSKSRSKFRRFSERFEREARVIASLNHPNICQLYDVGPTFLVMELVEGPTLAERSDKAPFAGRGATITRQMAESLEAAHEKAGCIAI
jgi:serine/threonine protein kinase